MKMNSLRACFLAAIFLGTSTSFGANQNLRDRIAIAEELSVVYAIADEAFDYPIELALRVKDPKSIESAKAELEGFKLASQVLAGEYQVLSDF